MAKSHTHSALLVVRLDPVVPFVKISICVIHVFMVVVTFFQVWFPLKMSWRARVEYMLASA